ncbi:MAG: response regulator [Candidatus Omnitrophota bacterium]
MYKILVVDDEVRIVEIIAKCLNLRGFKVEKAYGGQEALDKIKKNHSIDLIVLDKKMPGVDGVAVMRELKKTGCEIPVIVITGSISKFQLTHIKGARFDHVLFKPLRLSKLLGTIDEILTPRKTK